MAKQTGPASGRRKTARNAERRKRAKKEVRAVLGLPVLHADTAGIDIGATEIYRGIFRRGCRVREVRICTTGSVSKARGDSSAQSYVDMMAEFDAGKKFSLLDMVLMENRLADILNMPVDLAPAKSLKDGVRERAIRSSQNYPRR